MKKRIMKLLAGFFIVMLCCTVIARAADSFTVAKVEAGHVKRGRLTEKIDGSGSIKRQDQVFDSLPEGQKVKKIAAREGDQVVTGDPIAELDMDYLKERMDEQTQAVEKLKLQINQQKLEAQPDVRVPETAQAGVALNSAERTLANAKDTYQQASNAYDSHNAAATDNMTDVEYQTWKQENDKLENEMKAASQAVDAAAEAYNQASDSYNLASRQEEAAKDAEGKKGKIAKSAQDSLQVDLEAAEVKLQKLQAIMDSNGVIAAKADGIFTSIGAKEGTITTGSEQIVLSTGGLEAAGALPDDLAGKVEAGDKVKVTIAGNARPVELKIDRIGQSESAGGEELAGEPAAPKTMWYAKYEKDDVKSGTALSYEISKNSKEEYDKLIPLGAIRSGQGEDYVLAVKVKGGILGKARTAVKVPVTVLAKDGENAAVDANAALDNKDQFVISSNKYVEVGDRVRLKE